MWNNKNLNSAISLDKIFWWILFSNLSNQFIYKIIINDCVMIKYFQSLRRCFRKLSFQSYFCVKSQVYLTSFFSKIVYKINVIAIKFPLQDCMVWKAGSKGKSYVFYFTRFIILTLYSEYTSALKWKIEIYCYLLWYFFMFLRQQYASTWIDISYDCTRWLKIVSNDNALKKVSNACLQNTKKVPAADIIETRDQSISEGFRK